MYDSMYNGSLGLASHGAYITFSAETRFCQYNGCITQGSRYPFTRRFCGILHIAVHFLRSRIFNVSGGHLQKIRLTSWNGRTRGFQHARVCSVRSCCCCQVYSNLTHDSTKFVTGTAITRLLPSSGFPMRGAEPTAYAP